MGKKGTREKSPEKSASPPPLPTKARARRAGASVVESEKAHSSGLELSSKKNKKGKKEKEKKEKKEKKSKKDKKAKEEEEEEEEEEEVKEEEEEEEEETKLSDDNELDYSESEKQEIRDTITVNFEEALEPIAGNVGAPSPWRFPGALSPYVDSTAVALVEAGLFAVVSGVLSRVARYGVTQYAMSTPSFMDSTGWGTVLRTSAVQGYWALAASIGARAVKHVVGWNDIYSLSALNVLISAPMVYLLSMFYSVPMPPLLISEAIDFAFDILPVLAYKQWIRPSTPVTKAKSGPLAALYDPIVRVLLAATSTVLYHFMTVLTCRLYLPEALILHFAGISTVEPARVQTVTPGSTFTPSSLVSALTPTASTTAISAVCALAASFYIFERLDNPAGTQGLAVMKPVAMRSLAASAAVSLGVFVRCVTGVYSVDATGAALYNIVWTLTPLINGILLGYVVSY